MRDQLLPGYRRLQADGESAVKAQAARRRGTYMRSVQQNDCHSCSPSAATGVCGVNCLLPAGAAGAEADWTPLCSGHAPMTVLLRPPAAGFTPGTAAAAGMPKSSLGSETSRLLLLLPLLTSQAVCPPAGPAGEVRIRTKPSNSSLLPLFAAAAAAVPRLRMPPGKSAAWQPQTQLQPETCSCAESFSTSPCLRSQQQVQAGALAAAASWPEGSSAACPVQLW
jgi:hypothetical protein